MRRCLSPRGNSWRDRCLNRSQQDKHNFFLYMMYLLHSLYTPPPSKQTAESYFYVPDLGQVPEIDVPSYLPDLPGIADDLSYSADLGPGFAPSGPTTLLPELPSFSDDNTPGTHTHTFNFLTVLTSMLCCCFF